MKFLTRGGRIGILYCAVFLGPTAPAGADDYVLQPGDVLSVMVIGWTEIERSVQVEMDGAGAFPFIGEIEVAGATLGMVRDRVADAYALTSFPGGGGADAVPQLIQRNQVHVAIEELRPVYIYGDLLRPSIIEFHPGLTLRQAIALSTSGNFGDRGEVVTREHAEAVTLALARAYGRIWSLKTYLGTDTPQDYDNIFVAGSEAIQEIVEIERSLSAAVITERELRDRSIAERTERAEARLVALMGQKASEEEGWQADEQILADVRDAEARGLAPAARLSEVRRTALSSATRVLELDAAIEEVRTELVELEAESQAAEIEGRSVAWSELGEAIAQVYDLRAQLATLQATGAPPSQVSSEAVAVISRRGQVLPQVDVASDDLELQPGDSVEIFFTSDVQP